MTKKSKIRTAEAAVLRGSWFLHSAVVISLAVSIASLFFFPSLAASEIYKWKDPNGNVIFSDSPPPDSNVEEVRPKHYNWVRTPSSKVDDEPKIGDRNTAATRQPLRDAGEIRVVMYMTDW